MNNKPILWIVIPCYNEEEVLPITSPIFLNKIKELISKDKIDKKSRILFVNDGSKDKTWNLICALSKQDEHFIGISQSRNRGHQNAVLAGLMESIDKCDITISIDCDGQDDINAMDDMVEEYLNGCEIVYGVRSDRKTDTWFKRTTAQGFYKILKFMGADVVYNHADYRLVSNRVIKHFADFKEVNLFLRGLFPLVGFKSTSVYYERSERIAGESHYPFRKMLALAFDGITSLSVKPITFIISSGFIFSVLGVVLLLLSLIFAIFTSIPSTICFLVGVLCFLSGVQLIAIGIVGVYIGKTYMETKARPRYIISEHTRGVDDND
ncbi:MAG: glycosyltransferase family 2 protein [Clostridia bacterium]|nr:glycosyltransferase family 2 protein [Clostridia bacterium]